MVTACPLDCFDSCSILFRDSKLEPNRNHKVTKNFLCPFMNNFLKNPRVKPRFRDRDISLDEALEIFKTKIFASKNPLYYKGSGNLAKMQSILREYFADKGTIAVGSLCDGVGASAIEENRGAVLGLSFDSYKKFDVVILWGRNLSVTNSHFMELLKDKKLIVIDPVAIDISKRAELFIQIEPNMDLDLALALSREAIERGLIDKNFIEKDSIQFDSFKKIALESDFKIESTIKERFFELIKNKRVLVLSGLGVSKTKKAYFALRAIDSLFASLGFFDNFVAFLSDSFFGFKSNFKKIQKVTTIVDTDFSNFDFVLIQGANPLSQMPNTKKVKDELSKTFVVYFGLYENETSQIADLVIPAKNFLEKNDIRFSYAHEYISLMPKILDNNEAISEYELTELIEPNLGNEVEYIEKILNSNSYVEDGFYKSKTYIDGNPYKNGFFTKDKKFHFLDEEFIDKNESEFNLYLITAKTKTSLNSQFKRDSFVYINPKLGFNDNDEVKISSKIGSYIFKIKNSDKIREDSILIYSGSIGVNYLTTSEEFKNSAIYQEQKVKIEVV